MSGPTISVILPTCNRHEYLQQAVASVVVQTRAPAELLVVEAGQGAEETLARVEAPFPIRVLAAPGAGPGAARNVGLRTAGGEYVAFLDDDDLWHPEKLAWQAEWLGRRPEVVLLGTGGVRGSGKGRFGELSAPRGLRRVGRAALVRANRLVMSSVMARRECLVACGGFDEGLPLAQDWDLWLRAAARGQAAVLPAPLTYYRVHTEQRSARQGEMRRWEGEVIARAVAAAAPGSWLQGVARRRLAWARYRLGRVLLREQRPESGLEALRESVALNPWSPLAWGALAWGRLRARSRVGVEKS